MRKVYLGVFCLGCQTPLFWQCLGPYSVHDPIEIVDTPDNIELPCGACRQTHFYNRNQLKRMIFPEGPDELARAS